MMAILVGAAGLALLGFFRWSLKDHASPVSIYILVWCTAVALFHVNLVTYDAVGTAAWLAIAVSAVSFLAGGWTALLWGLPFPDRGRTLQYRLALNRPRFERTLLVLFLLGLIGFLLQLHHLQQTMGLGTFLEDPVKARNLHSNIRYWGYLNILNVANVPLAIMYRNQFPDPKRWVLLLFPLSLASALLTTDRTRLFYTVMWGLFAWLYLTGGLRLSKRKTAIVTLVFLGLMGFFLFIGTHFERQYGDRFAHYLRFPESAEFMVDPYIYLTGSIPALNAMIEDRNPLYFGKFSFSPVVTLLQLVEPGLEPVRLTGEFYYVPMEINTFSYLHQFYLDFGWFGVLLGPFVCGFLCCWVYQAMRRRPDFFGIYLASLLAYCCFISFFVNMFTQEATWFFALVGWVLGKYLAEPGPEHEP